jgi:hypothetical protein
MARRPGGAADDGAVVVEFALVLPVLMVLLLGMFSGATAWNQNQTMGHGARIAARHAATLPLPASPTPAALDAWLDGVADLAVASSAGELGPGQGRTVCVAYVHPVGAAPLATRSRTLGPDGTRSTGSAPCVADDQAATARRIQVVVGRDAVLDAGLYRHPLRLHQQVTFAYEAHVGL